MANQRKAITVDIETRVLTMSRRRCCLCYGYDNDLSKKMQGQIVHIDKDPGNNEFQNLVWLCLQHHDEYDSRTSQSKGITPQELKHYRDHIYGLLPSTAVSLAGKPGDLPSEGMAENRSYINGGLKNLVRVDLLLLPDKTVSGTYAIKSGYSEEEEDRLSFGFGGYIEGHLLHVSFPSHRLPYPTDPLDQNCDGGKATWRLKVYEDKESLAISTYGRNYVTMGWHEYTIELDRIAIRPDERTIF